jgi:hypothetical protein
MLVGNIINIWIEIIIMGIMGTIMEIINNLDQLILIHNFIDIKNKNKQSFISSILFYFIFYFVSLSFFVVFFYNFYLIYIYLFID